MSTKTCRNCLYWSFSNSPAGAPDRDDEDSSVCRRFPPIVIGNVEDVQIWPQTENDDWCGEWKRLK